MNMKHSFRALFPPCLLLWLTANVVQAQTVAAAQAPASTPYGIAEQDANHKLWQRVSWIPSPSGSYTPVTNSYTEVQTAMSRNVGGQWVDCNPQFQVTPIGAQATNTAHSIALLGNLNSSGSVTLTTPEGKQLVGNILGISYFDNSSGNSVWVGEIKDSYGQLLPSGNEALFSDAFSGCLADVLYVNSISKFEQIVVVRSQLPPCTDWGFDPTNTMLCIWTEFINPPQPTVSSQIIDGATDSYLDFGSMRMVHGEAFAFGDETNRIPVIKQWLTVSNRQCLVEEVPLISVLPLIQTLPPATADNTPSPSSSLLHKLFAQSRRAKGGEHLVSLNLPSRRTASKEGRPIKLAARNPAAKGLALDYTVLTSQTNAFVFQGDSVYYVSGAVNLGATNNVVEGLAVIKFTNSPSATITANGIIWQTRPFAPAVFTSKDDNTVGLGDPINGSTGNPSGYYGGLALDLSFLRGS